MNEIAIFLLGHIAIFLIAIFLIAIFLIAIFCSNYG